MKRTENFPYIRAASFLLALLVGAHAAAKEKVTTLRSISINASTLSIDGNEVWLGDKLGKWLDSIPGKPRCFHQKKNPTLCVWDDIGLEVGTSPEDITRVEFINVYLAADPLTEAIEKRPSFPTGLFDGNLELDGFKFDAKTEFRAIGMHANRSRELTCGGRSCGSPYGYFNKAARIDFWLDRGSDRGHIIRFSINCSSTERCAALIPEAKKVKGKPENNQMRSLKPR